VQGKKKERQRKKNRSPFLKNSKGDQGRGKHPRGAPQIKKKNDAERRDSQHNLLFTIGKTGEESDEGFY